MKQFKFNYYLLLFLYNRDLLNIFIKEFRAYKKTLPFRNSYNIISLIDSFNWVQSTKSNFFWDHMHRIYLNTPLSVETPEYISIAGFKRKVINEQR